MVGDQKWFDSFHHPAEQESVTRTNCSSSHHPTSDQRQKGRRWKGRRGVEQGAKGKGDSRAGRAGRAGRSCRKKGLDFWTTATCFASHWSVSACYCFLVVVLPFWRSMQIRTHMSAALS